MYQVLGLIGFLDRHIKATMSQSLIAHLNRLTGSSIVTTRHLKRNPTPIYQCQYDGEATLSRMSTFKRKCVCVCVCVCACVLRACVRVCVGVRLIKTRFTSYTEWCLFAARSTYLHSNYNCNGHLIEYSCH